MREAQLQDAFVEAARLLGYLVAHFRPARTAKGWRTPVSGDGKGFPDVIAIRPPRLIVVEFKSQRGRLRPEQRGWMEAFARIAPNVEPWLVRPAGLDDAIERLRAIDPPPAGAGWKEWLTPQPARPPRDPGS